MGVIILSVHPSVTCVEQKHAESHGGCVYIFCDCQNAIDDLTQHHKLIKHLEVCVKVKHLGELSKAKLCIARIVRIQGHTGIAGNEHADLEAKMVAMN